MENSDDFLSIVNKSGFLFQTRVEKEIANERPGGWEPIAHEHRWVDSFDGKEGYIDLILEKGIQRLVIECKKSTDSKWIFLTPVNQSENSDARLLWTYEGIVSTSAFREKNSEWYNFKTSGKFLEALFCIVRGQGENDTPLLERLSSHLLRSVENLAKEEMEYERREEKNIHIYYPLILTNAKLLVCRYDSDDIDISTGQLAKGDFEEVPAIKFRKNLSSSVQSKGIQNLKQANSGNERTVFIVNSNHIVEILKNLDIPYSLNNFWPWQNF
jgi:hypothetical protein